MTRGEFIRQLEMCRKQPERGVRSSTLEEVKRFRDMLLPLMVKVPYEDESEPNFDYQEFLLSDSESAAKPKPANFRGTNAQLRQMAADNSDDLEGLLANVNNKKRRRTKTPVSKKDRRAGPEKKAKLKEKKKAQKKKDETGEVPEVKPDVKSLKPDPVNSEEGKLVYSKLDFASHAGAKGKKSHKNPREILKDIKQTRSQINELMEQGETSKAAELQNDLAWKKAFDKLEGKKVKDDEKLLKKAIKMRKVKKTKAKKAWNERKERVEEDKSKRQKKRETNLQNRSKDKKIKKLKKASKQGRIIPGY